MDIYIPPTASDIADSPKKIRIGIQGMPGTGKTVSALTFPNPIILNFDDTDLKELIKSTSILKELYKDTLPKQVPFYSEKFITEVLKQPTLGNARLIDRREAFAVWLEKENTKFMPGQTLILDSWSSMQDAFDAVTFHESQKVYAKTTGEENFYVPWDTKISYSQRIIDNLKSCNCHVVVLFHEQLQRDKKTGELLDKVQPLMQGKFITEIKRHFPYFVRQGFKEKEDERGPAGYVWQTKPNDSFDPQFRGAPDRKMFMLADYKNLI